MNIVNSLPPNWDELADRFGVSFENVCVTYGENCHAAGPLSRDVYAHEEVHVAQQTGYPGGPAAWWRRYIDDGGFRYSQEVEAYRVQVRYLRSSGMDRNKAARHIQKLAGDLAGPMYGNVCTVSAALAAIRS